MAELNFKKLADAPVLEEVPDGAKVYAEVDGKVYRVAGDNLGGGVKTAIFYYPEEQASSDNYYTTCQNMTYDEAKAMLLAKKPIIMMGCGSSPSGCTMSIAMFINENRITSIQPSGMNNYWYPDGTITNDSTYTPNLS